MNALDEVLNSIRVRSTVYCPIEVGAPWDLYIEEERGASFCIMTKGSDLLVIEDLNIRRSLDRRAIGGPLWDVTLGIRQPIHETCRRAAASLFVALANAQSH